MNDRIHDERQRRERYDPQQEAARSAFKAAMEEVYADGRAKGYTEEEMKFWPRIHWGTWIAAYERGFLIAKIEAALQILGEAPMSDVDLDRLEEWDLRTLLAEKLSGLKQKQDFRSDFARYT